MGKVMRHTLGASLNIRHNLSSSKGPKPLQLKLLTTYIPKTSAFTLAFSTSQLVTEQSVRFQTALASIKLIQASAVLDLTEDDFDFLTSNKVWIATDRSRARRCVEACVYG